MTEGTRKTEILDAAASLFATSGVRASLKEIADACGILPGSLYHHFESKEALVVELVERFHAELEQLADAALAGRWSDGSSSDAVIGFGRAIAGCAVRHRAALLWSLFDAPAGAGAALRQVAGRTPGSIHRAMTALLRWAQERGDIRDQLALDDVADRICQSMLHVGVGVYHRSSGGRRVPELKCRIVLGGLATRWPDRDALERGEAHHAADEVLDGWRTMEAEAQDRAGYIRRVARSEFAKRGVELTTIRDVAAAAGIPASAVYRVTPSKEALIESILRGYVECLADGWTRVFRSAASPVEKLDALLWLNVNVLDRFHEEFRIQTLSLQQRPPKSPNLAMSFPARVRQHRDLLAEGDQLGMFRLSEWPADTRARCLMDLVWIPENLVRQLGTGGALELARDTVLRGVAVQR